MKTEMISFLADRLINGRSQITAIERLNLDR